MGSDRVRVEVKSRGVFRKGVGRDGPGRFNKSSRDELMGALCPDVWWHQWVLRREGGVILGGVEAGMTLDIFETKP